MAQIAVQISSVFLSAHLLCSGVVVFRHHSGHAAREEHSTAQLQNGLGLGLGWLYSKAQHNSAELPSTNIAGVAMHLN